MKNVKFTDDELEAVRLAVAQAAGSAPEQLDLRTALVKLDHLSDSGVRRRVEIIAYGPDGTRCLYNGLTTRWRAHHVSIISQAKWRARKVVVRIDGSEVDPCDLGENEAFS